MQNIFQKYENGRIINNKLWRADFVFLFCENDRQRSIDQASKYSYILYHRLKLSNQIKNRYIITAMTIDDIALT